MIYPKNWDSDFASSIFFWVPICAYALGTQQVHTIEILEMAILRTYRGSTHWCFVAEAPRCTSMGSPALKCYFFGRIFASFFWWGFITFLGHPYHRNTTANWYWLPEARLRFLWVKHCYNPPFLLGKGKSTPPMEKYWWLGDGVLCTWCFSDTLESLNLVWCLEGVSYPQLVVQIGELHTVKL